MQRVFLGGQVTPVDARGAAVTVRPVAATTLKLYVKSWCPWCIRARRYLDQRGYTYTEFDVQRDPAAYAEMIQLSGQRLTPTLDADGEVLADFGPDELEAFLREQAIEP